MFSEILRATAGRQRVRAVRDVAKLYEEGLTREAIEEVQAARFNERWAACLAGVPFYKTWAAEHDLPVSISCPADLRSFPDLTKKHIQERQDEVFDDGRGGSIVDAYSTGGTTGTPTRFPRGGSDFGALYPNTFVGRSWWGLQPFDSYVHVWGHSHLFGGKGLAGRLVRIKRSVMDLLVNAVRVNAYDMSDEALESHSETILRRNPTYVVGYTSAIFRIARHLEARGKDVSCLTKMRAVLVTAETVTVADVALIERVFRAPVIIEYGAAETGVIAFSQGATWPLSVLWRSFIVLVDEEGVIRLTTLDDRAFPLINYVIGDIAEGGDVVYGNALSLGSITGRTRDVISVRSRSGKVVELSPILPVHILKGVQGVTAVQYHQSARGQLEILVSGNASMQMESVRQRFAVEMTKDYPDLDHSSLVLELIAQPKLTKAGKQALFV